jgi:hypothetical protein
LLQKQLFALLAKIDSDEVCAQKHEHCRKMPPFPRDNNTGHKA